MLPSALNLPQTNPSQTVEYAPVPPDDEATPDIAGNLSSLGLGSSSSIGESLPDHPVDPGAPDVSAIGRSPTTKRCVGHPPRQTEDPLSPPCVSHFAGDNFGATYAGVTGSEIRI